MPSTTAPYGDRHFDAPNFNADLTVSMDGQTILGKTPEGPIQLEKVDTLPLGCRYESTMPPPVTLWYYPDESINVLAGGTLEQGTSQAI